MKKLLTICAVATMFTICGAVSAGTSYSTSFESSIYTASDAQNADGVLYGQDGWSGGAQATFTNDDYDLDNGNGTYGDEKVTTADAHSGLQCWRYSRGYGSPGEGTPFSPALDVTTGAPGSGADFDTMIATLWFKPVDSAGDGSSVNIYQGTPTGDDRTGFNIYIESTATGINVGTYRWNGDYDWEDIATGLTLGAWHSIDILAKFTDDYVNDQITYTIDKGTAGEVSSTGNTWTHPWREANSYDYVPGDSLKFAAGSDGDTAYKGVYFDDIHYEAVPEPATLALLFLGGLVLLRRRRK